MFLYYFARSQTAAAAASAARGAQTRSGVRHRGAATGRICRPPEYFGGGERSSRAGSSEQRSPRSHPTVNGCMRSAKDGSGLPSKMRSTISEASRFRRRIRLIYERLTRSASANSRTEANRPSPRMFCHRHARASALTVCCSAAVRSRCRAALRCAYNSPPLEAHWNAHDERDAVEPTLHHAAILSRYCCSSQIRLASPSALIRASSASSCTRPARRAAARSGPAR
jgi:hypothetical protein